MDYQIRQNNLPCKNETDLVINAAIEFRLQISCLLSFRGNSPWPKYHRFVNTNPGVLYRKPKPNIPRIL